MSGTFMDKSFSVAMPIGKEYRDNWEATFGNKTETVELHMTCDPSASLPAPIQEMFAEAEQKKETHPAHAEHAPICCCGKDGTWQSCPADPDHRECSCCDSCHRDCLLPGSAMSRRSRR